MIFWESDLNFVTVLLDAINLGHLLLQKPNGAGDRRVHAATITRRVVLDETFNPGKDIQVFLQDGFAKICAKNPILSHVKQPWPEEGIIDLLMQQLSG